MRVSARIPALAIGLAGLNSACGPARPIQDLPQWQNRPVQELFQAMGRPTHSSEYTLPQAPTKAWQHSLLFAVYPRELPQHQNVLIKEYFWVDGAYGIHACCHRVDGHWRTLGAKRIHRGVIF